MAKFGLFKFFSKEEPSKDIARERLKLVLLQDRYALSSQMIDAIKADLNLCMSKYLEVEDPGLEVELMRVERDANQYVSQLVVNIPIRKVVFLGKNTVS